jgi:hypothetical protein
MFIKPSQKGRNHGHRQAIVKHRSVVKNKQYLTTIQTESIELNRELMRPGEKRTQVKSINKNERQGYVQEHNK